MKKTLIIIFTLNLLFLCACGCAINEYAGGTTQPAEEYSYTPGYVTSTNEVTYSEETSSADLAETTQEQPPTVSPPVTQPPTTALREEPSATDAYTTEAPARETTLPQPSDAPSSETSAPAQTTEAAKPSEESTTVNLGVELPQANGTMQVDNSSSNKFISAVVKKRSIDASLLAAVYSVPESGQNYVLEFNDRSARSKNDLRRVYLLNDACEIVSVAAAKVSEKENISSTENWFCFNVLIKGVIFDAIANGL